VLRLQVMSDGRGTDTVKSTFRLRRTKILKMRDAEADQADTHRHVLVEQLEGDLHEALHNLRAECISQYVTRLRRL
jgi:hypothetical protein